MKKFRKASTLDASMNLPENTPFSATRSRSEGILSSGEIAFCRAEGISLSFDPMQHGWVTNECHDDLSLVQQNELRALGERNTARTVADPKYQLRAWCSDDVDAYIALLDDPEVWRFLPEDYPNPISYELAVALIELSNASNHHSVFAVVHNAEPIGQVRLEYDVEPGNSACAEISYWLGKAHWNKGIANDVVTLFTSRSLRDNMGLTSLIARVHQDNTASLKALAKAGYVIEGADPTRTDWIKLRYTND